MSAPTSDEELDSDSKEELERRADAARDGEETVSFEEYREQRDAE